MIEEMAGEMMASMQEQEIYKDFIIKSTQRHSHNISRKRRRIETVSPYTELDESQQNLDILTPQSLLCTFEEEGKFEEEGEESENVHSFLKKRRVEKSVISDIEDEDDINMIMIADGVESQSNKQRSHFIEEIEETQRNSPEPPYLFMTP